MIEILLLSFLPMVAILIVVAIILKALGTFDNVNKKSNKKSFNPYNASNKKLRIVW